MNERIELLAKQASSYAWQMAGDSYHGVSEVSHNQMYEWRMQKFAELIVRECANHCDLLLDHKISSEWSRGTHDCSRAIKKHFGVEE